MPLDKVFRELLRGSAALSLIGLAGAVVLLLVTRWLLPRRDHRLLRVPAGFLFVHLGALALGLVVPAGSSVAGAVSFVALLSLLLALGRIVGLLVLEVLLHRRLKRAVPTILRDIGQGVLYLFLVLAALRALGFDPGSILTTGAVVTAVIGLSLQETLGNLVAGLAIQLQRPFDVGDWVSFDDEAKHIGRVNEINWRATKVTTLDDVELIVPNGMLAKVPIVNYTKPTARSRRSVFVSVAYEVPPRRVHEVLLAAIRDAPGVLAEPAPSVVTKAFADSGIEYWIRFWTEQFERRDVVDGAVRDRVYYALHRAGFTIPFPQRTVHLNQLSEAERARADEARIGERERALARVDLLQVLDAPLRRRLAALATTRLFSPGETIVREGEDADELFIIERGTVSVLIHRGRSKESSEVTRLGPGQFFGEMALVTGEKRQATVRAVTECELMVIGHGPFHDVLAASPTLVQELSRVLAERQSMLDEHAENLTSDRETDMDLKSMQFFDRIKKFFEL